VLRSLVVIHRWLGIGLGPLFAMWFASGIVMHFVPFPQLDESERIGGQAPLKLGANIHGPADAVTALGIADTRRVRLIQRADGPVYIVTGPNGSTALKAGDLASAGVRSSPLALAISADYARRRGTKASDAAKLSLIDYDQWTVSGQYQPHRPLYRLGFDDDAGTDIYISSKTGEVVLDTTRWERGWNFVGSVPHWIYPPQLRSQPALWSSVVWWLSLAALVGAIAGAVVGVMRLRIDGKPRMSPYRGMHWWHHIAGLATLIVVTSWIFSGWLSMDGGLLFSRALASNAEMIAISGTPSWDLLANDGLQHIAAETREVEWFGFGGKLFRREITAPDSQRVIEIGNGNPGGPFLPLAAIRPIAAALGNGCSDPTQVEPSDDYATRSAMPNGPVYRVTCGEVWYDIDAANGMLAQKTDASRRAYRWLYGALHTLDFPPLAARPILRSILIVSLCGIGFLFSMTGIVIGWRRLRYGG
jgi:hypothetical protein